MTSHTIAAPAHPGAAKQPPDRVLRRVTLIAAAASLGGFLFGYDSAVINGAVTGIQDHFRVGATETGTVVAVALLGSALGASVAGRLADRLGRIRVMRIAAALFAVSAVATAFNWIANWAVTETFPRMAGWNLSATYVIYAAFAVLSLGFIAKAVHETNGKPLEEMG